MHTPIFSMHSIPCFSDLSSISGNLVTQTPNQCRCGGNFVRHGYLDLKNFWRKELNNSGSISTMSWIGVLVHAMSLKASKLTEHRNRPFLHWLAIPWLQKEVDSYVCIHNTTHRWADHYKLLPNGFPDAIFYN